MPATPTDSAQPTSNLLSYQPKLTVQEAIDVFLERERTLDALTEAGKDLDSDPVHIAPLHEDRSTT